MVIIYAIWEIITIRFFRCRAFRSPSIKRYGIVAMIILPIGSLSRFPQRINNMTDKLCPICGSELVSIPEETYCSNDDCPVFDDANLWLMVDGEPYCDESRRSKITVPSIYPKEVMELAREIEAVSDKNHAPPGYHLSNINMLFAKAKKLSKLILDEK